MKDTIITNATFDIEDELNAIFGIPAPTKPSPDFGDVCMKIAWLEDQCFLLQMKDMLSFSDEDQLASWKREIRDLRAQLVA